MKDSRFTELLNLYLDHRLSPADAAELEAEVMRNPDRRRVYSGYCRMQRACNLLFENECERAPQSFALARALNEVNRKLANGEPARRPVVWLGWSGAVAAACVAVVSVTVAIRVTPNEALAPDLVSAPTVPAVKTPVALASAEPSAPVAVPPDLSPPSASQQQWSRIAAQRWIDAEAESLMASRLVDDDRFVIHHASDKTGIPSFQLSSTRGELTSYQFQR